MPSTYFLKLAKADTEELLALAYGNLAEVSFVAKRHIKELANTEGEYLLRFTEVSRVGGVDGSADTVRVVTSISADGDTVSNALKRKLAAEKKQADALPADRADEAGEGAAAEDRTEV
jgi:hypothetical protein